MFVKVYKHKIKSANELVENFAKISTQKEMHMVEMSTQTGYIKQLTSTDHSTLINKHTVFCLTK